MEALAGRDRSQTARQMLTAPGERRIVRGGEGEAHHPEQGVQEPFGLAQRKMVEESQGQGGFDGKIRVPPLPTPPAAPAGRPVSDRVRGQPHRHIAAANEGPIVGRPIRHAVLRLIRGMNLRLHPCSVAPAETRRAGQTAPPAEGLSCNNATVCRGGPLTCPNDGQTRAVEHEMEALAGRDRSQTARQMLTAPGERRIVRGGEGEAHHPEQGVQEPFGLAQRKMVEESQGQGGFDGKI